MQRAELGSDFLATLLEVRLVLGRKFAQTLHHRLRAHGPQLDIEPHMRVVVALELRWLQQALLRHALGDGVNRLLRARELREDVGHLPLQHEAVVEDDLGLLKLGDIGGGGLVEVRVHARAHEAGDFHAVTADLLDEVRDHRGGGGDADFALGGGGRAEQGDHGKPQQRAPQRFQVQSRFHVLHKPFAGESAANGDELREPCVLVK